jgi:GTP cyclohydrolase II
MKIEIEVNESQLMAAAQVLKRIGFTDIRALSANDDEAYSAQYALEKIRAGLAAAGYNPR